MTKEHKKAIKTCETAIGTCEKTIERCVAIKKTPEVLSRRVASMPRHERIQLFEDGTIVRGRSRGDSWEFKVRLAGEWAGQRLWVPYVVLRRTEVYRRWKRTGGAGPRPRA